MFPEFFTPQHAWFDQVARIYLLLQNVQVSEASSDHNVELRRMNRINSIHSSTAIEGNRLSLEEVSAVIDGKIVLGPEKDVREVQNAWAVYEAIDRLDPYSVNAFLYAHGLLTQGLVQQSGKFRVADVEIVNAEGNVLHTGSRAAKVPRLVRELLEWAEVTDAHPLISSSAVHFMIEQIHPFADGNGRIGRLWQTLLLSKWNPLFEWLPTETLIAREQSGYYNALQSSRDPEIDAAPFITFMLGVVEKSLADYQANVVDDVVDDVVVSDRVLAMLATEPRMSAVAVADRTGLSSRQVQRIIKEWKDRGVLTREGSPRYGRWVVRDNRFAP